MTLSELQTYVVSKKGEFSLLQKQLEEKKGEVGNTQEEWENHTKARWLLSEAQIRTQTRFKEAVESLVSLALRSVYDRPFSFILDFSRVRNKLECTPSLQEGDVIYNDIRDCQGGGLVDIIALAFRLVLWHLKKPHSRNTILLDEPLRFLGSLTEKAGEMLREISHRLGIQIVMVSHSEELIDMADRSFNVTHNGTFSTVKQIGIKDKINE
jgi:DNA repair exonuclease SbcCD ATPase subunit